MRKEDSLRRMLHFLHWLIRQDSSLSKTKFNEAALSVSKVEASGWRHLAGEGAENIDEVLALFDDKNISTLSENLHDPSPGRPVGSRSSYTQEIDDQILAAIEAGKDKSIMVRKLYNNPTGEAYRSHMHRITNELNRRTVETMRIIALQTRE